jgi:hypothetical protein
MPWNIYREPNFFRPINKIFPGNFIAVSKSVPRAVASVALAKNSLRKSRSLPLAVLIRRQYHSTSHPTLPHISLDITAL